MTHTWWMKWRNRTAKTDLRKQLRSFRRRWFPRFNLERLEDRIAPTLNPLTYTIGSNSGPNAVTVQLSGTDIQIVNSGNTSDVLAHQALASTSEVDVSGSSSSQSLSINVNSFVSGSPALSLAVSKSGTGINELAVSGVSFVPVTFTNIPTVTVDASTTSGKDTATVSSDGLLAAGLQNFTLETGSGNDTFADNAASFSLPASGGAFTINTGGGSNTLDFTNFTGGPLKVSSDGKLTITAADNSELTQSGTPAQHIDVNFASGAQTAVDGVLDKLSTLAGDLQTGAGALSQLTTQLPLLDPTAQGSLGQVLGFSQKISDFVTKAKNEISTLTGAAKLSTIVSDLNQLSSSLPSGFGSLSFTSGYRGAPSDSTSPLGQLEGLIGVQLSASAGTSIPISLGTDAQDLGLNINGNLSLAATLTGNLTLGLTTDSTPSGFLVPSQTQTSATGLTLGTTTGTGVTVTAAAPIFSPDEIGDEITYQGGSAVIRSFTDGQHVTVDILSPFSTTSLPSGSWTLGDGLTLGVQASLSTPNAALNLGFLSASINGGSVDYSGTLHLGLADPDSGTEITTSELADSPSSLVTSPQTTSSFSANLPVSVTAGVQIGGSDLLNAELSLALPSGASLFNASAPTFSLLGGPEPNTTLTLSATSGTGVTVTATADAFAASDVGATIFFQGGSAVIKSFTDAQHVTVDIVSPFSSTTLTVGNWMLGNVNLLDFSNVTPTEVMGMLGGVYNTFLSIAGNGVLNTPIPFTGKTVGDLLDYATAFKTKVLDPLFVSGNSLVPDSNGDGVPDFNFSSIQELVNELTTALGLGTPLVASYDPSTKELTFALSFDRALGFGQANMAEAQAGDASHDETQTLTINAINSGGTLTDTYRLAFPDPTNNGVLQFTSAIPYDASAATIQSDLEALNGIGSGNVQVTGTGPYTITFTGALADKSEPLLVSDATQLAGAFPINFGASLGSLASLQTSGNFGVTAGLSAGLTFGVDLHPSDQVQITPPVYSPAADVTIAAPVGSSDDTTQLITVKNATAGTYVLAYNGQATGTINYNDDASTIASRLNALSGVSVTVTDVTPSDAGNEHVYQVDFTKPSNPTLLTADPSSLMSPASTGILSGTANFGAKLYNNPSVIVLTTQNGTPAQDDGTPGQDDVQAVTVANATGGTFTLSFDGKTTAPLAWNASEATVAAALAGTNGIVSSNSGDVAISLTGRTYTITFQGALADTAVDQLQADSSGLTNTSPADDITVSVPSNSSNTSLADLANDVQTQINTVLVNQGLTLGFLTGPNLSTGPLSTSSGTITATGDARTTVPNDIDFTLKLMINGNETDVTGQVRAVNLLDANNDGVLDSSELTGTVSTTTLADQLQAAINSALNQSGNGGFSVTVGTSGSKLTFTVNTTPDTGDTLEFVERTPIEADGGGGRISLSTTPVELTTSTIQQGVSLNRELDVSASFNDPAYQELGLLSAPTHLDGNTTNPIQFTLVVNGTPVAVTLAAQSSNSSIDDLVSELQSAVDTALISNGLTPLGFTSTGTIADGSTFTATQSPSSSSPPFSADMPFTLTTGGKQYKGTLTASDANSGLTSALQTAMNNALSGTGVTVTVGMSGGDLTITPSGGDLAIQFESPVQVFRVSQAGVVGNRIGFQAAPGLVSKLALNVPELVSGNLNGAITDLGFAPGNGATQRSKATQYFLQNVHLGGTFSIVAAGVQASATLGFLSITATGHGTLGDGLEIGTDAPIDLNSTPIPLGLTAPSNGQLASDADFILSDGTKEVIGSVSAASTASFTTRADLQTAIQNAINSALTAGGLSGTITVNIDATTGAITLTGSSGLTILGGGKIVDASANFSLVNPEDGTDKLTADILVSALSQGEFFYDAAHQGTDINGNPTTGIISGTVSGGIGARLDIAPGGALAGLSDTLHADAALSATSPNWLLAPPSLNDPLGFGADPTALSTSAFTLANAAPSDGQLTQNISFIISDNTGHSAIGVLNASDTSTFSNTSQLVNALQGAVNDALARLHAAEGGSPSTTTITVGISGGNITFTASDTDLSIQGNLVKVSFEGPDFTKILDKFNHLSLSDILGALKLLVGFLRSIDGSDGSSALASALSFKLPLVNRSVSDLVDIAGKLDDELTSLEANPAGSVQQLEKLVRSALDIPDSVPPIFSLDTSTSDTILDIDLNLGTGTELSQPFDLDLSNAGLPSYLTDLLNVGASGNLDLQANANFHLAMGLDFTDKSFFLRTGDDPTQDTALTASASASGNNLAFDAKLGPFGLFVKNGTANLNAGVTVTLLDPNKDGRLVLAGWDGGSVTTDLGHLGNFINSNSIQVTGTASANLPLYVGTSNHPIPLDFGSSGGPLGFPSTLTALGASALKLGNAAPSNGKLSHDASFIISDGTHQVVAVLRAADTSTFSNTSQLVSALQGAVNDALTQLHTAGSSSTTTITVGINGGKITLTASGTDLSVQDNDNALGATVDVVKLIKGTGNAFAFTLPDFDFTNFKVPSIFSLLSDPASLVDGLDNILQTLQQGLSGQLFGTSLPFLGDLLANDPAVNFLGDVRNDLLKPLANTLRNNNVNLAGLVDDIKTELVEVLGPNGPFSSLVDPKTGIRGLLKDENGDGVINTDDIIESGVDPNNPFDSTSYIQFDFDIGKTFQFQAPEGSFNLGIPALNLQANFQPEITINFNMHFGFGLDTKQGFYFVTNKASDTTPEASVSVKADLGNNASVSGQLLFLALGIKDGLALDPSNPSQLTFSSLSLGGDVFLRDPNGDGRLTFAEMRTAKLSDIIKPSLSGGADLLARATVDFSTLGSDLGNVLPSITTDILVHFGFEADPSKGFKVDPPSVALANVSLDLGSFISKFAEPILSQVKKTLDPLSWMIGPDGFLNKRIPLISDLAGHTVTGADLVSLFDPKDGPKVVAFLNFVQELYHLADLADSAAADAANGGLDLNFGDLILTGKSYFESSAFSANWQKIFTNPIDLALPNLQSMSNLNGVSLPDNLPIPKYSKPQSSKTSAFTSGVTQKGSIDFELIKPATIFKLLMGQPDVTLVTVTLPQFGFNFFYRQVFPIVGPLVATFGGGVGGNINLTFGYDTHGLQEFEADKNPADLIDGFFIDTLNPATGQPQPQIALNAQIAVGAAIDLGFASAGVEGGITATINFALDDLNNDTKVRLNEIAANLEANDYDPLAIFDISGEMDFFLRAFITIDLGFFSYTQNFEFANLKLFSFNIPFTRPALLASQTGDTLTLNIGPNAAGRLHGDLSASNETIHVATDGGKVYAWSDQYGVDQTVGKNFEFSGIKHIVATGGSGNEFIDLSGVTDPSISASIQAGDGNDTIIGGAGNDVLTAGAGNDVLVGNGGNNTLNGGAGTDELFGNGLPTSFPSGFSAPNLQGVTPSGSGSDSLVAGTGNTLLYGGSSADTLVAGSGNDTFIRSGGGDTYQLASFVGAQNLITGSGSGQDILDFTGATQNLTFLLNTGEIDAAYDQIPNTDPTQSGSYNNLLRVDNPTNIVQILGGGAADTYHVFGTAAAGITLNGQKGNDQYVFHVDPSDPVINATVTDTGNPWDSGDTINVAAPSGSSNIRVTNSNITLDAGQATPKEVVTYTPPAADANVLQIQVNTGGGNNQITVANTAQTVPVRVDTGDGNNVVTVGDPTQHTLSGIVGLSRPGLNAPTGLGPLVLVGGSGQDAVLFDDSSDTTTGQTGNITAFDESRTGFSKPVEVGVVSGLGMQLSTADTNGNITGTGAGRVEFEGFSAVNVKLGPNGNHFTVGGDAILSDLSKNRLPFIDPLGLGNTPITLSGTAIPLGAMAPTNGQLPVDVNFVLSQTVGTKTYSAGGTVTAASTAAFSSATDLVNALQAAVTSAIAQLVALGGTGGKVTVGLDSGTGKLTLAQTGGSDTINFRGQMFVNTITGMTAVIGGSGGDTFDVLGTNQLDRDTLNNNLNLLSVNAPNPAGLDVANATQTVTISPAAHDIGYFTLQYAYDETAPIPFGATPAEVQAALVALPLIGTDGLDNQTPPQPIPNVQVTGTPDNYTITFGNGLAGQQIAPLVAKVVPLLIQGGSGVDTFNVQSLRETSFLRGGDGADTFNVNVDASTGQPLTTNGVNAVVTLDGQGGGDTYNINLIGGIASSLINVFDTGAPNSGVDLMTVNGQNDLPNLFLLRASASELGEAFIGLLNNDPSKPAAQQPVERVNYDTNLEGITVNGGNKADRFYVDDTRAQITLNGGAGNDFFQIGQLYQTQRTAGPDTNIAASDGFATIDTTDGWLSNGVSQPMTINGGDGDDTFIVFHNLAVLNLYGQAGNDTFVVQAFALVGSKDDARAITNLSGGAGADLVQYAVDAPVHIDGGDGFDTVIIIGTEFADDFVITNQGVFGAGLNVSYVNVEHLVVDGGPGNDRFFIDSTAENMVTEVDGGLGSDLFSIGGPTPGNGVISKNLKGHSGIISTNVVSSDLGSAYNGIDAQGVGVNVADNDEPAVIVTPTRGTPMVVQNDPVYGIDSYTVVLSRPPLPGHTVTITAVPPQGLLVWDPSSGTWTPRGVQLSFDDSDWYVPQTVQFKVDDSASSIPDSGDIQMSVAETIVVNGQTLPGLIRGMTGNNGAANIDPTSPDGYGTLTDNSASFPGAAQGLPQGLRGANVRIVASLTNPAAVGQTRMITSNTATTLTVDSPWTTLPTDAQYEISLFDGLALPNVHVKIYSQQKAAIVVHETDGSTSVAEDSNATVASRIANKADDEIDVRLSQAPQTNETVTVNLSGQGLSFLDAGYNPITQLTFNQSNWNQTQTVYVEANDPQHVVEGFRQVDMTLTATSSLGNASSYAGASDTRTVTIADQDSPGVRIIQPNGTTDVAEFTDGEFGTSSGAVLAAGFPAYSSYQVVLTRAPAPGETVTVNELSEPTRTTRGGGLNGLVSFTQQLLLSSDNVNFGFTASLQFTAANWDVPQTVYVHAVDNQRVDGTDTTVFPPALQEVNPIRGPLIIHGGPGADRTGLLERPAVMLPYEQDVKPHIGAIVSATEASALAPATVTINTSGLTVSALSALGITINHAGPILPSDLVNLSLQVTDGPAKNKVRIITGAVDNGDGTWTLTLSHPWLSPFTGDPANPTDPSLPDSTSHYTLEATNPNLLVDERDQSNLLQIYDTDNPSSYNDPALGGGTNPQAVGQMFYDSTFQTGTDSNGSPTFLDMFRVTGLGMGGDRAIGGLNEPGGISFDGVQNIDVNLGSGNNHFTLDNTPAGAVTRLNTGAGNDLVDVKSISGHTFITSLGSATINVHDDNQTLQNMLGLLTVSGDPPQAIVTRLVNGSAAVGTTVNAVNEIQQVTVNATGGTFALSLDGQTTIALQYGISAADMEAALVKLPNIGQTGGLDNVSVTKAGNVYRIEFVNGLGDQAIDLLATHDLGLTNGLGDNVVLNVDDSGTRANTVGTLTSSSLTGLSTQQVNAIQTIFVNASQGHFTLSYGSATTAPLPYDISAADLQTVLQNLAGILPGDVVVSRDDKDIVVRFQGNLANQYVAPLVATAEPDLLLGVEQPGGGVNLVPGTVTVSSRVAGTSATQVNDMQAVTVNATAGTYTLSLLGGQMVTAPIAYDASADAVQSALQAAYAQLNPTEQFQIDVTVNRYRNVYFIGFQGKLRRIEDGPAVDELQANTSNLTGTVSIATRTDGLNYYGVENLNIDTSTGNVVFNVQGTSAGSNGYAQAGGIATTNITFHGDANSSSQVYVSSNADLDFASSSPAFDFLSGNLNDIQGALNLNTGSGTHRLMISNESSTVGATNALITRSAADLPGGNPVSLGLDPNAEIWVTGLAPAGISYQADRTNGNFFDGITYWTGSGDDKVTVEATENRPGSGSRTMTLLNTGLGNNNTTVNLKAGPTGRDDGQDGFFALNTMGGSESSNPESITGSVRADDTVNASASTLPLIIFGSIGNDNIRGGQGGDIILGHFGRVQFIDPATGQMIASLGAGGHGDFTTSQIVEPTWIYSRDLTLGGNDVIHGGAGEDILIGGTGNDAIDGGGSDDLVIGGAARLLNRLSGTIANPVYDITNPRFQVLNGTQIYDPLTGQVMVSGAAQDYRDPDGHVPSWASWQIQNLYQTPGSYGNNYIAGGGGNNEIFGGAGSDVIQGAGSIDYVSHLEQSLAISSATWSNNTATITTSAANGFQSGESVAISGLTPSAYSGTFAITVINSTTFTYSLATNPGSPGTGASAIVTGLALAWPGGRVGVANADSSNVAGNPFRDKNNALELYPSFIAPTDGDNYIEGGGGNNIIFGGGGQNDIIGGNSDLFSLTTPAQRPSGSNLIFGGAGTDVYRNDPANVTDPNRHAQNSDMIISNNGDIFRLVGVTVNGQTLLAPSTGTGSVGGVATSNGFLAFNYDINRPDIPGPHELIIPRGAKLLDYTPGGPAYNPTAAAGDIGGFSEIHAENGDAFIFGEAGHPFTATGQSGNVIFGGSGDDQIVGGYGNNWITGGTGNTAIVGQDGRIYASRNGLAEPLNGVTAIPANQLNQVISTPGKAQQATINIAGQLKTTVDLEPFSEDTTYNATAAEWQGGFTAPHQSDNILFGGLGNDTIHGGSGDDAISGGQALSYSFLQTADSSGNLTGIAESDWYHPYNPGNTLRFNPTDPSGTHAPKENGLTGQFALYNEFSPRSKILLNLADGSSYSGPYPAPSDGSVVPWVLDLNASEQDGNDALFGDLGNNWIVAGTGQNNLYGGFGNDLLDARSSQDIDGGLNDVPNTVNITNRAYGGAGKDVLIADTAADRLIDWVGNFDTYIVPFAPWGMPTVSRTVQPRLPEFLYALSQSDGADQTLAADFGTDATRNGEPAGELGIVLQHDTAWHQQTGAPSDQPPGNIGGVPRVVLKSASLTSGQATSFLPDSGTWSSSSSGYTGSAAAGSDAVSLLYLDQWQPNYLEFYGTVRLGGANNRTNGFLIFNYQSPTNFLYAGIDGTSNLLRIGQRTASGWVDDATLPYSLKGNNAKTFEVILNGTTAQLVINGTTLQYNFSNALNVGMLGLGLNGTSDSFTSYTVQTLARVFTYQQSPAITSTGLTGFTVQSGQGSVNSTASRYLLTPPVGGAALNTRPLNVASSSYVEFQATVNAATNGTWAGLVFDYTSPDNYLFAAIVPGTNQVILGHRTPSGWFIDAVSSQTITAGTDYTLLASLDNSPFGGIPPTVSVVLNGKSVLSYTYNFQLVGGPTQGNLQLGLLAQNGAASFSNLSIRGDDPAYAGGGTPQMAATPAPASANPSSPLTSAQLAPVVAAAIERWSDLPGMAGEAAVLRQVPVTIAPLPGQMLGETIAGTITINPTAAGYGWFVDATPLNDTEFAVQGGRLVANQSSPALGRMDLETVVLHELGHVLGLPDLNLPAQTNNLMATDLQPGIRRLPDKVAAAIGSTERPTNEARQTGTALLARQPAPSTGLSTLSPPMTAALGLERDQSLLSSAVANVFSTLSAVVGMVPASTIDENNVRSDNALLLQLSSWLSASIAEWLLGSGSPRGMSLALPAAAGPSGAWSSGMLARNPGVDAVFAALSRDIPLGYPAGVGDLTSDSLLLPLLIDELLSEGT